MSRKRQAFTLVELLVALVLLLTLAALALALMPRMDQNQKVARGADLLQGWLLIAKQRAVRDQVPTGVRLFPDSKNYVNQMQYVQQPDDFFGGTIVVSEPSGMTTWMASLVGNTSTPVVDYFGGFGSSSSAALWPVQPGDYLEVKGGGWVYLITGVTSSSTTGTPGDTLALNAAPVTWWTDSSGNKIATSATSQYRIIRAPRLLTGETPLDLPQDVVIDLNTNLTIPGAPPIPSAAGVALPMDIMFSPSGSVIGWPMSNDRIVFWLRDSTTDSAMLGNPALVTIYVRTGLIAAAEVDHSGSAMAPYTFTQDGRSSGL
jgi:prepilin-type N-terminal cleavage/methylation domain-containing protein